MTASQLTRATCYWLATDHFFSLCCFPLASEEEVSRVALIQVESGWCSEVPEVLNHRRSTCGTSVKRTNSRDSPIREQLESKQTNKFYFLWIVNAIVTWNSDSSLTRISLLILFIWCWFCFVFMFVSLMFQFIFVWKALMWTVQDSAGRNTKHCIYYILLLYKSVHFRLHPSFNAHNGMPMKHLHYCQLINL